MPEEVLETPQPFQLTESKSSNWPKIILAAVLGFGLLAGAAYAGYWYGTREISNLQLENQNQTTPTPTPTTTPTPEVEDETADWKTYTYPSKTGESYEIKYPQNWGYGEGSGVGEAGVTFQKDRYSESYVYVLRRGKGYPDQISLDKLLTDDKRARSAITVGGVNSILLTDTESGERDVYLAYGNYIFSISETLTGENAEETKAIFDTMLSTFKFTD